MADLSASSASKDDFLITGINEVGNFNSCLAYSPFCLLPIGIDARGVAKDFGKVG